MSTLTWDTRPAIDFSVVWKNAAVGDEGYTTLESDSYRCRVEYVEARDRAVRITWRVVAGVHNGKRTRTTWPLTERHMPVLAEKLREAGLDLNELREIEDFRRVLEGRIVDVYLHEEPGITLKRVNLDGRLRIIR